MGSEDSTDSSVSAQKEKGTKLGSLLKGAFGSMAKAVKGSKPEKRFFGREKVKDDYIESLECINGIHSNSDPELPDITKRNVMPGRFAKVEAPKVRTEIRPKTFEVMDEVPAEEEAEEDIEIKEVEEPLTTSRDVIEPAVHVAEPAEPVVFVRETERKYYEEEEIEEAEVDYFDFLPPMKTTERAPVRKVSQSKSMVEDLIEREDEVEIEAEEGAEEAEDEEEHVTTKEEVFIDLFDSVPEENVTADVRNEPADTTDVFEEVPVTVETQDELTVAADVPEENVITEIDLDILDVPVAAVQEIEVIIEGETEIEITADTETVIEEATVEAAVENMILETEDDEEETETEVSETTKEEVFIDLFDGIPDEAPVRAAIDLDILDVPVASAVQEYVQEVDTDDEEPAVPEICIPVETIDVPVIQEMQRAVPEAAVPIYGRLSIDFDAFDRVAESPLDARFDVEEVECVRVLSEESFDITSLESASIPAASENVIIEAEVQVSPINVEIDLTSLETPVSPINVEIDLTSLETPVSPINVEIDLTSLETPVSPINVEIDLTSLETPVSPINVEIDMISLTAARIVIEIPMEDHASYVPNFILVSDEDVAEVETESELSAMMPEAVLKAFDSEHKFLEIDVFDVAEESCDLEINESEVKEFLEINESEITDGPIYLEIDESEVKEFLEINESEITDGPIYLEIDESEVKEFLEINESEVKEFLEINESEVKEFLEINESEITEVEVSAEPNYLEIDESEITEVPEINGMPMREIKASPPEAEEGKGGIFFSFFTKEDKEDSISISFGETKEDDDVIDDSHESVSARDDYAVTVSPVDGSRKFLI